jgi:hypothetical protein
MHLSARVYGGEHRQHGLEAPEPDAKLDAPTETKGAAFRLADQDRSDTIIVKDEAADSKPCLVTDLHLDPPGALVVGGLFVLGDKPLETTLLDRRPRLETIIAESSRRIDQRGVRDGILQGRAPIAERPPANIAPAQIQAVERHEYRRCRNLVAWTVKQVKLRDQVLIEDADLCVEDHGGAGQRGDGGGHLREALGVVPAGTAEQPDTAAVLLGDDAPAVVLLLEHPAVAVEGLAELRRERIDFRKQPTARHRRSVSPESHRLSSVTPEPRER